MNTNFIVPKGDYRKLIVYKKGECIYDITFHFAHRFLSRGDRTVDQMIQSARSCKQNIIEGSAASKTSRETEIKLFNVAKASLDELLADYEDYLRVRNLMIWSEDKQRRVREFCRNHNESALYREIIPQRGDETIANLAITIIHQEIYLLIRLIERAKRDFLECGGIREEMTRARIAYRNRNSYSGSNGRSGNNGRYGNNWRYGNNGSYGNNG
ncbi:MAG: four helix bundle suffix domain-containing protein, partial [Muribaculaceae bacterium]|nr:four helix bundle suffix domain-containing protein [Muribaculaceae bacterium]